MFRRYTPDHFDNHGYLKAPIGFYLVLVVLLRPYIIWLMSVANRNDPTQLIGMFYPVKSDFFIGLATGVGALLVFALASLRRKDAYSWLPSIWKKLTQPLIWLTLLANVLFTLYIIKTSHFNFSFTQAAVVLSLFVSGLYLSTSHHLKDFFSDWPEDAVKQPPSSTT